MTHFWSIFSTFGTNKKFPENLALLHTTSYRFLGPSQNLEKKLTIYKILSPRQTNGWTKGQIEGQIQTLFYRTFKLLPVVQKNQII